MAYYVKPNIPGVIMGMRDAVPAKDALAVVHELQAAGTGFMIIDDATKKIITLEALYQAAENED